MNTSEILQKVSKLHGIIPGAQKNQLITACQQAGAGPRIEIGCLGGLSTCCIALASSNEDKIISVDPFRVEYLSDMAKGVISQISGPEALKEESFFDSWVKQTNSVCWGKNLVPLKGDRLEMLDVVRNNLNGEPAAFLFIDGLHTYEAVTEDIDAYVPLVKSGGYIVFHDYSDTFGVKRAVDDALRAGKIVSDKRSYMFVARRP